MLVHQGCDHLIGGRVGDQIQSGQYCYPILATFTGVGIVIIKCKCADNSVCVCARVYMHGD